MRSGFFDDIVDRGIQQKDSNASIGRVTKIYPKETDDVEEGNIEVNVQTRGRDTELRRVPVLAFDHTGHISVPRVGDYVLIEELKGSGTTPYVTDIVYTNKTRAPHAREGHWRHEFGESDDQDRVYLEAEPADGSGGEPDLVRMGVKEDGLSDPTTEVAVDNSSDTTEIRIQTDGDIYLNAEGDILIGDRDDAEPVARADHVHDVEIGDNTHTTDTPDDDGTSTKIA